MSGWGAELLGKFGENRPDYKECPSCMLMIDKEAEMCPSCETIYPGAKAASTESSSANNDGWGDFGSGGGSSGSSSAAASADGWGDFGSSSKSASASSSSSSASSAAASNSSDPWGTGAPAPAPAGGGDDPWGLGAKASSSNEGQGAGDDLWAGQPASGAGESEQKGEEEQEQEGPSMEELLGYFVARGQDVPDAADTDTQITGAVASLLHSERSLRRAAELGAAGRPWGWGSGECDQLGMAPPPAAAASGQKGKGKARSGASASAASGSGSESDGDEDEDGDLYLEHAKLVPALQPEHCKEPAVFVTAGGMHTVAVLADGTAVSWGCNDEGQLGRKSRGVLPQPMVGFGAPHPMAAQLSRDLSGSASAAAGTATGRGKGRRSASSSSSSSSSAAVEASQDPVYRYLLEAGRHDQLPPLDGSGKVVSVGCGDAFTVVLDSRGRVFVCGRLKGPEGRFGVSPEVQMMPFLVEVPGVRRHGRVVQVAAGYDHAVFATASGKVLTWGLGHVGQLGRPEAVMRRRSESMLAWEAVVVPLWRREAGGRRKKVLAARVAAGGYSTYVLTRCGRVMATGHNHYNQLGVGVGPNLDRFQVAEALSGKGVVQLAPSKAHLLALTRAGDVIVCGRGDSGQLGLGSSSQEKAPVSAQLAEPRVITRERFGGEAVMQVAAGSTVSAAVTRSGRLFAWGFGDLAQLGNGAMRDEAVPFDTSKAQGERWGGRAVLHVTVGGQHIVALVAESAKPNKGKGPYDGAALLQASEEYSGENEAAAAPATAGRKRSRAEASGASSKPAASKRRRRG